MYQLHGLTGSNRIVFEDLCQLQALGIPVSVSALAEKSGYDRTTVIRALRYLRQEQLIDMHHENGKRGEYIVLKEDSMAIGDVLRSLFNIVTMPSGEWMKRLTMAIVAKKIYDDGHKLKRLAHKVGGGFEDSVIQWMDETGILRVMTIWDLNEAQLIQEQIGDLIAQAKEQLE